MISIKLFMATFMLSFVTGQARSEIDLKPECVMDGNSPECLMRNHERMLQLTREDCDSLMINAKVREDVMHKTDPDVKAPGSITIKTPENDKITMSVNRYINTNSPDEIEAGIGTIVRSGDGKIYYNGQPLFDKEQAAVEDACKKFYD